MLSYRHAFHAGNHGDILKHAILALVIDYLKQKDKPFVYIDTHAGAGQYQLTSEQAQKTREYEQGITQLWQSRNLPDALQAMMSVVRDLNPDGKLKTYPGSPQFARHLMRTQDRLRLFELHPSDWQILCKHFAGDRQTKIEQQNGFSGVNALLPPAQRRALILYDPPYEQKQDYTAVIDSLAQCYKKFPGGVYIIWYPLLKAPYIKEMMQKLESMAIKDVLRVELEVGDPALIEGMYGSGLILVNAPWSLPQQLQTLLPFLNEKLAQGKGNYRIVRVAEE